MGSQKIIVFHELLSLGCINFKNICAYHEEEVLRFPKHPQLVKLLYFLNCHNLAQNHPNFTSFGVFWKPHDLLFMIGTEIFKIDAS